MNRARIIALGLAIAIAVAAVGAGVAQLKAFNPQPDPPGFGMVGIAEGQTARLNLVNLIAAGPAGAPPDPCRVELQFLDGDGSVVVARRVQLAAGHAAFLDFTPAFVPVNTVGAVAAPLRAEIRGSINVVGGAFGPRCRATIEIFDNATARTAVFMPAGAPVCRPGSGDAPPDPCRILRQELNGQ